MLAKILDRKKRSSGSSRPGESEDPGLLLKMMEAPVPPSSMHSQGSIGSNQAAPSQSGSILTGFSDAEAHRQYQLQQEHAAFVAYQAEKELAELQRHMEAPNPVPVRRQPRAAHSQAEQLDLLADELAGLQSRLGPYGSPQTEQNQPITGVDPVLVPDMRQSTFSFDSFIGAILGSWKRVLLFSVGGAALAAAYAMTLPNMYQSTAEILIEPRGLKVMDNAVAPNGLNSEATVAYAESQVRILTSSSVVDPVIELLDLTQDPEFIGSGLDSGLLGAISRLSGSELPSGELLGVVKKYLYDNLEVRRINQTFMIQVGVTTTDSEKSARIANALAHSYMADESGARSLVARSASRDLTARLDDLRNQVRDNEVKVERYKAENGLIDANGKLVSESQLTRLNDQLVLAKVQAGDAKTRAKLGAEADLGDVISGSLPSILTNATVNQLRLDYTRATSRLEKLSTKLGERHPERIAAESERRSTLKAISQEMKRIVKTAQENYKRAKARQDDLAAQVNQLKAAAVHDSAAKVKLRELNRQVDAGRQIYESILLRSRETGAQENIRSSSARLISEAVPEFDKTSPNRKLVVAAGGIAGAAFGIGICLVLWFLAGLRLVAMRGSFHRPSQESEPDAAEGDLYSTDADPYSAGDRTMSATARRGSQLPLPGMSQGGVQTAGQAHHLPHDDHRPPYSALSPERSETDAETANYYSNWGSSQAR
jgi:uncharacterized protein involved in exopolysaccharide biosynthesis